MSGTLYGVGTGPGDPELLTLKAVRLIESADIVAYFAKRGNASNARRIVATHLVKGRDELPLLYPVTTEIDKDSADYRDSISGFFDRSADAIARHLGEGRNVVVLSEGDPLFYGSYMHLHVRLAGRFKAEVVPGISAMSGCWSRAGTPIVQGDEALTVLAGTMAEEALTNRLRDVEAAVIMKVGRNLPKIRRALAASGRLPRAIYVERGTMPEQICLPLAEKMGDQAPYFSLVLVPGWENRA